MSTAETRLGIVVGVDGSAESEAAVRWAAREAIMRGLPLTMIHAVAPVPVRWPATSLKSSFTAWQAQNARDLLERAEKTARACADASERITVRAETRYTVAATALIVASHDAEMTVVGSRGLGAFSRAVLGSVSHGLLHHGHGPVAIIRDDDADGADARKPVLVGVDGSFASEASTELAFDEASRRGVDLVALHAWSDVSIYPVYGMDWRQYEDEGHATLAERLAGWQERYPGVRVHRRVVPDQAARWLTDASAAAQLVVLGSHGHGAFSGMLLGSVSARVAQTAVVPVLVVRPR